MEGLEHEPEVSSVSRMLLTGLFLAVISFAVFFMSGFGYNWNIWSLGNAFQMFKWGATGALAGLLLTLIGAAKVNFSMGPRLAGFTWIGVIAGILVVGTAIYFIVRVRTAPPIHDITTDINNPPEFKELREIRERAPNEVEYPGGETAEKQREHYPEIQPLYFDMAKSRVFKRAVESARQMRNWEIHATDSAEGRIEATHTIMWFGFKDDVVIRVRRDTARNQVRVDMRSASRVGGSDLGENARRIKRYQRTLRALLDEQVAGGP